MSKLEETVAGLTYNADGLIPAVIVDAESKRIVMVAYMNETSLLETIRTDRTHFWSRSRQKYWMKGEESGHTQDVKAVYVDCDKDTLVIQVTQHGAACHNVYFSCFYRRLTEDGELEIVDEKIFDPKKVYKKKGE